jgi:hypothetical protein
MALHILILKVKSSEFGSINFEIRVCYIIVCCVKCKIKRRMEGELEER